MQLKNKYLSTIFDFLCIFVGIFMMGFAFNSFFYSNGIAPGGFSGLAAVITDLLRQGNIIDISPTILYILFNIVLIFFAIKILGKRYFFYSVLGIVLFSICIEYLKIDLNLHDLFLATIFGAVLMGVGTGLVVRGGASTGGGEMLGKILHELNPDLKIGNIIFLVDLLVLILSFAAHGLVVSLYTFIAIFLSGKITDFVLDGGKGTKAYYIISDKNEEISQAIIKKLYRGATLINGKGVYSKVDKKILLCLVNKYEARNLQKIVFEIDDKAFLFSTSVIEAYGEGFLNRVKYLSKPKKARKKTEKDELEDALATHNVKTIIGDISENLKENKEQNINIENSNSAENLENENNNKNDL